MNTTTPEVVHAEVIVVGAGASGIPAAIAAARQGARVVLLEEDAVAGGAPLDMYVTFLCGGPRVGIFQDMANRLNARYNLTGAPVDPFANGGLTPEGLEYWYMPSAYLHVLSGMMAAEPALTVVCGARVSGVLVDDAGDRRRVKGVTFEGAAGRRHTCLAPVTIDATGTGEVAALAGCDTQYGRNARTEFNEPAGPAQPDNQVQRCTWMYISQRVKPGAPHPRELLNGGIVESNHHWVDKQPKPDVRARNTGIFLHWGATVDCRDTRDPLALAAAQRQALDLLAPELEILQAHGYVMHLAPKLGVREVRRVVGDVMITANDLLKGLFPDDTIACCEFFLDAWGEHDQLPRTNVSAGIPYRALVVRGTEGLLVAGKAISGTHLAMSAYRVQPIVASIGTAAGIAAALAARLQTGVRSIPVADLQARLRAMGVIR